MVAASIPGLCMGMGGKIEATLMVASIQAVLGLGGKDYGGYACVGAS